MDATTSSALPEAMSSDVAVAAADAASLAGSAGAAAAAQSSGRGNGSEGPSAKRFKRDEDDAVNPSPVLHVRSLPLDATEYEVRMLMPVPQHVIKIMVLRGKGQAFVQFVDVDHATDALRHFESHRATVRNKLCYLQYSRRTELDMPATPFQPAPHQPMPPHQQLQQRPPYAQPGYGPGPGYGPPPAQQMPHAQMGYGPGPGGPHGLLPGLPPNTNVDGGPGCVLHVSVVDCYYPVTIDILHTVFQPYGPVIRIVLVNKKTAGYVEAPGNLQALVQFSDAELANAARMNLSNKYIFDGSGLLRIQVANSESLNVKFNNDRQRDFTQYLPAGPPNEMGMGPPMVAPGLLPPPMGPPMMQQPGYGHMPPGPYGAPMDPAMAGSPVVLASRLNEEKISADALFTLFGVYGDVQRVKILYNKRHTALVQMTNHQQAQLVVRMLNNVPLYGSPLSLVISSHMMVKLPRPGTEEAQSSNTISYEKSEFHRFAIVGSKNYQNITPPNTSLHLSNLPADVTEETLRMLFGQHGVVTQFRFFPGNIKMAIVQMSDIGEAVDALVAMHQYPLTDRNRIRVSFAKTTNQGGPGGHQGGGVGVGGGY